MTTPSEHWVPKVHPLTRDAAPDDPMELIATPVGGDPEVMLECLVQEFAGMGWSADELLALFPSPAYPLLNLLQEHFGANEIRRRVDAVVARSGVLRVVETIVEEPDPDEDDGPELIPLSVERLAPRG